MGVPVVHPLHTAFLLALFLMPATAAAQSRWDVAASARLFTGHLDAQVEGGYQEDWFQAAQAGVVLGRYLSRHIKVEFEASATSGGRRYASHPIDIPAHPYPYWVSSEVTTSVRSVAGVLAWQCRENEWVHPFVAAGISADVDRIAVYTPEQFFRSDPGSGPLSTPVAERRDLGSTMTRARAVLTGGAKVYFRERAFVRTDARLTWGPDRQHLALRAGVGVDF